MPKIVTYRCIICDQIHAGLRYPLCPDCYTKQQRRLQEIAEEIEEVVEGVEDAGEELLDGLAKVNPVYYVVGAAIIMCPYGSMVMRLLIPSAVMFIEGKPAATIQARVPGVNIQPFGICALTKGPCMPQPVGPWTAGQTRFKIGSSEPLLSSQSTLGCSVGGTISVVDPGQTSVCIGSPKDTRG